MRVAVAAACVIAAGCSRDVRPGTVPTEPTALTDSENPVDTARPDRDTRREDGNVLVDPGAEKPANVTEAIAILHSTRESAAAASIGVVHFRVVEGDLQVSVMVDRFDRGAAVHVHVFGDCAAPGPRFHFTGSSFAPDADTITGYLGELQPGETTTRATIPGATLQGAFSIIGRSVVVETRGNDGTGPHLACGAIGVAREVSSTEVTNR